MKRYTLKSLAGVTLLEIMLVLAIAAMIIVMSVRYYQTASSSQAANSALQAIQAVTAAADGISQGTGTYADVTDTNIKAIAGSNALNLPWNKSISITNPTAAGYQVTLPSTPKSVCTSLKYKLKSNPHYKNVDSSNPCTAESADFMYEYIP